MSTSGKGAKGTAGSQSGASGTAGKGGASGTAGKGGQGGGSVYDQSAGMYNQAGNLLGQAAGLYGGIGDVNPYMIGNGTSYNPARMSAANMGDASLIAGGTGYNPARMSAANMGDASLIAGGTGYNAARMNAARTDDPRRIVAGMSAYSNPYNQQVVNNATRDIQRLTNQQDAQTAAEAANVGAFGGSRQGLMEAVTRSEAQKNIGDLSANLRHQGFNTAAQLAGQDVQNLMQTGQFNAGLQQQARLANQDARNLARQFGATQDQNVNFANQAATNAANQFNAGLQQQARMSNQDARNTARQFGAVQDQNVNFANQAATNSAHQFNAGLQQQARMSNQDAKNTARQFGAVQDQNVNFADQAAANNARQFNVNTAFNRAGGLAALSPLASNLAGNLFNTGQQINQDQMGAGSLQQQLMQQILGRASGQYDQFMGAPQNLLNMQLSALGMNPMAQQTTTTGNYTPGLFDYLGLGVQGLGAAGLWRNGGVA